MPAAAIKLLQYGWNKKMLPSLPASARCRARHVERGFPERTRKFHVMRAAELFGKKIDLEFELQILAVPLISAQELLVIVALLVPMFQQRRGDIDALSIPALRNHVDLLACDFLVDRHWLRWIGNVEQMGGAVHKSIHP